jgi:hypothetical protein
LKVDQKGDKRLMQLDVLGVVRDAGSTILSRLGGTFDIQLDGEQYKSIENNNIYFRQDIELEPGTYTLELIVRDRLSGKIAAKREQLVLPAPDTQFSTSGIVLSRLVLPAAQPGATDVLTSGGAQIRPSPSRGFHAADNLIIFFELYNAATNAPSGKAQVKVTVTLAKDGKAAMKPISYMLTETLPEPVPHLTFAKFISLAGLPTGSYAATIEARDMATNKLVTQQTSFVITK